MIYGMNNIFFTADLHLGHQNILRMYPDRPFSQDCNINLHDEYIIAQWNTLAGKYDDIYILGDLSLHNAEKTRKILERLNGRKYLCPGNHDSALKNLQNYFVKVEQIMSVRIKKTRCHGLETDLEIVLCHYPLLEWDGMNRGAYHLHGHCHGNLATHNTRRMDVGIDATKQILTPLTDIVHYWNRGEGEP